MTIQTLIERLTAMVNEIPELSQAEIHNDQNVTQETHFTHAWELSHALTYLQALRVELQNIHLRSLQQPPA